MEPASGETVFLKHVRKHAKQDNPTCAPGYETACVLKSVQQLAASVVVVLVHAHLNSARVRTIPRAREREAVYALQGKTFVE